MSCVMRCEICDMQQNFSQSHHSLDISVSLYAQMGLVDHYFTPFGPVNSELQINRLH